MVLRGGSERAPRAPPGLCRSSHSLCRQYLAHLICIKPAQVVALQCRRNTIAVVLPEGNASFVVCCRFQQHMPHTAQPQIPLALQQQSRRNSSPPKFLSNVQSNDMCQRRILLGQNKSRNVRVLQGNKAVGRTKREKITQRSLRVRNPSGEASLIKTAKRSKVLRIVRTKHRRHSPDSTP